MGIHVDAQRNVYVADCYRHEISKWVNGRRVGGTSQNASPLNQPRCASVVVADSRGNLFIADTLNQRIIRWEVNATQGVCIVGYSTVPENRADQLSSPKDVTFDWKGNLLVADTGNNRVQSFDLFINTTCGEYRALTLTHVFVLTD
jgi:DNA-binding beta-propeller fold protein YncE